MINEHLTERVCISFKNQLQFIRTKKNKGDKVDRNVKSFFQSFLFLFLNKKKVTSEKLIFEMYMKKKMLITSRETQYYYKYSDKEIIHTQWWYKNALNTRSEHLDRNIRVYLYRNIVIIKIKLIKSHLTTRIRTFFVTFLGYSFERKTEKLLLLLLSHLD